MRPGLRQKEIWHLGRTLRKFLSLRPQCKFLLVLEYALYKEASLDRVRNS